MSTEINLPPPKKYPQNYKIASTKRGEKNVFFGAFSVHIHAFESYQPVFVAAAEDAVEDLAQGADVMQVVQDDH